MNHFKKIKEKNDRVKQRQYALSSMQTQKKLEKVHSLKQSSIQSNNNSEEFFVIKNLDNNKIEVYKNEESIQNKLLQGIDELPQIERFLEGIWEKYMTDMEKEEEQFLEACYQGDIRMVKKITSNKNKLPIDPIKCFTDEGKNGIHLATASGSYNNIEILRVLVNCKVDINGLTFIQRRTPLMLGSILGNEGAVQQLIKLGADVKLQDYQGNTALHHACTYNQQKIICLLIQAHASTKIKNLKNKTPLDLCTQTLLKFIVKYQQGNSEIAKEVGIILQQKGLKEKGQFETQVGQLSSWRQAQKMDQIAIKQIGISSFKKLLLLGRGAFGQVYLAQNSIDQQRYAVKVLDKGAIMSQNILRYAMTQRKILSTINHPFIVKLRYAFQNHQKLFLVMDYCPGGDLLALLKKNGTLQQQVVKNYMAEIVLAIQALHRAQIIYRDLKPSNIIIDIDGHACLTDFGLSKEASLAHSFCGSTAYLAPEMIWRRGHTKVLDWYLLGVVIYECLTGRPPFWDSNKQQLLANIKSGRFKQLPHSFSPQVRDLVQKLLRSNSNKRLGVNGSKQIKMHAWFADLNWEKVEARGLKMHQMAQTKGKPIKQQFFEQSSLSLNNVKGWNFNPLKPQ